MSNTASLSSGIRLVPAVMLTCSLMVGCQGAVTSYSGVTPISPKVAATEITVDELQPVFEWKDAGQDVQYDLIVYPLDAPAGDAKPQLNLNGADLAEFAENRTGHSDSKVYYVEAINEPRHQFNKPFLVNCRYGWAVRMRSAQGVSQWSTYDGVLADRASQETAGQRIAGVAIMTPVALIALINPYGPTPAVFGMVGKIAKAPNGSETHAVRGRPFAFYTPAIASR